MNKSIKSFLIIFFLYFIFLNFYFIFYSNNKYRSSYLFEKNGKIDKIFDFNNVIVNDVNNILITQIPTIDISIKKFKDKSTNQFLTESFLCLQENNLFIQEYQKKNNNLDKNLIKSISLQGGYFYNRKFIDKILIKFNHSESFQQAESSFINYFNFCFNKAFKSNNLAMSYFNFLENEVEKYGKYEFRPNIDQLKSIKIEKLNFEFLIKKYEHKFNALYYLSLICFGLTLSLILNTIFFNFFDKKRK